MKTFSNLLLSLIIVAFSGTVLAGENVYKATDNEELFGTWVNMDYTGGWPPQMIIIKLGEEEAYSSANDTEPMFTSESLISHKWTDAKGNIWYKNQYKQKMDSGFVLSRISESGKMLEFVFSQWEYPTELDISSEYYRKFTRK